MRITNKFEYSQPNLTPAKLTPNRSLTGEPFSSRDLARRHKALVDCQLWGVSRDHFQICANTAIHRSIFLPIPFEEDIYPFWLYLINISLKPSHKMWRLGSRTFLRVSSLHVSIQDQTQSGVRHTFKVPHLHFLWPGSLIGNNVQHTAVL